MTERSVPARLRPPAFLGALGLLAAAACSSDPVATSGVTHPTLIEVAPETFLGTTPCSDDPGAIKRYVATLFDITEEDGAGGETGGGTAGGGTAGEPAESSGFAHPSSGPVDCRASVGFGFVVDGRRYRAEVDGYDTTDLTPRGSGTRSMLGRDGAVVAPRWRTSCRGAVASSQRIVRARDCGPLLTDDATQEPEGNARLELATSELLGEELCGTLPAVGSSSGGEVERLRVALSVPDEEEDRIVEVGCGEVASFEDLPARRTVTAYVTAFSAGSTTAFAGANCQAFTAAGVTLQASCAHLNRLGTLRVDFGAALATLGAACDGDLLDLKVSVSGEDASRSFPPPDCLVPFSEAFKAGPASVTLTAQVKDGSTLGPLLCAASVEPGRSVSAECVQK